MIVIPVFNMEKRRYVYVNGQTLAEWAHDNGWRTLGESIIIAIHPALRQREPIFVNPN